MDILIAGINHFDPLCRDRLQDWLSDVSSSLGKPAFVAVEWSKPIFDVVKSQRKLFRIGTQERKWPTDVADVLTSALGFEGDVWETVFSDTTVLWLEQNRGIPLDDPRVAEYAERRLKMYDSHVLNSANEAIDADFLARISQSVLAGANNDWIDDGRDQEWLTLIMDAIAANNGAYGFAVVIVGANHGADNRGSLKSLLLGRGINVIAKLFV